MLGSLIRQIHSRIMTAHFDEVCMRAGAWVSKHVRAAYLGNKGGSYITIMSLGGLEFGILNIIASFGNVWCACTAS